MSGPLILLIAAWVGLFAGFAAWAWHERRRDAECEREVSR